VSVDAGSCGGLGAPCTSAWQCCSYSCNAGRCDSIVTYDGGPPPPPPCLPSGAACIGGSQCCSRQCDPSGAVCL
jgi:hypothetical protein